MSRSYTPGLKILSKTNLRNKRLLPMKGAVHFNIGDKVNSDDVVASTNIPGNVQMVNVANKLNIDPENIPECILVKLDEQISKGQIIAESKGIFGLFKSQLKSPIDGVLANISEVTGQIILSEPPIPVEIDAYTSGKIIEVIEDEGVIVESAGVMIQGILGIGPEKRGDIEILTNSPNDELTASMINNEHENKIIVGGGFINLDAYEKSKSVGVAGIVSGGFDYNSLSDILGYKLGVAITGSENVGPSLIITEGFGEIAMAKRTYELLHSNEGRFASINGATQIRAGVIRPEILIPFDNICKVEDGFSENELVISEGSIVRVVREPFFGKVGIVKSLPHDLEKMESETLVRIARIKFEDGREEVIPRANLEMIII